MLDNMQVDICAIIHEQGSVYCKLYVRLIANKRMDKISCYHDVCRLPPLRYNEFIFFIGS